MVDNYLISYAMGDVVNSDPTLSLTAFDWNNVILPPIALDMISELIGFNFNNFIVM